MSANLLTRGRNCVRQRRLPYAVECRLYAASMLPLHRLLLDPLLKRTNLHPRYISLEAAHRLHAEYPCRDGYKYDLASKRARAAERLTMLAKIDKLCRPLRILEVGGGDGQLSLMLANQGHDCTLMDLEDWRDEDVKRSNVRFIASDASRSFPLEDAMFDLCVSFNTMEHISDPRNAFCEMLRILRPGAKMFLLFAPLFNSAWGLHAYRVVHFPYPQFLLSPDDLMKFVADRDIYDLGRSLPAFQFVNRWSAGAFTDLLAGWPQETHCDIAIHQDLTHLPFIYRYRHAFVGHHLSITELVSSGVEATIHKHSVS